MSTDFSSIDRLVEFGLGLSLAQQMVSTMNHVMNNTAVAGVNAGTTGQNAVGQSAVTQPVARFEWYAVIDGLQVGALTLQQVSELIKRGKIAGETLLWRAGMPSWQFAKNIPEINKIIILGQ